MGYGPDEPVSFLLYLTMYYTVIYIIYISIFGTLCYALGHRRLMVVPSICTVHLLLRLFTSLRRCCDVILLAPVRSQASAHVLHINNFCLCIIQISGLCACSQTIENYYWPRQPFNRRSRCSRPCCESCIDERRMGCWQVGRGPCRARPHLPSRIRHPEPSISAR